MQANEQQTPAIHAAGMFWARVRGDSMLPQFPDGILIECRPVDDVEIGQHILVELDDSRVTFRTVAAADADSITLRSLNAASNPTPIIIERINVARLAVAEWIAEPA